MGVDLLKDELIRFHEPEAGSEDAELRAYQGLSGAMPTVPEEPLPPPSGPCALCREREATQRCVNCRRAVCMDDYRYMLGLCSACATDEDLAAAREGHGRKRPDLGIKWIED